MTTHTISTNNAVSDFELDIEVLASKVLVCYWHFGDWVVQFEIELDNQRSFVQWVATSEDGIAVLKRLEHWDKRFDYHGDWWYSQSLEVRYDPTYVTLHKLIRLIDPKRIDFHGR